MRTDIRGDIHWRWGGGGGDRGSTGGGSIPTSDVKSKCAYTLYMCLLCKYHSEVQISFQNLSYFVIFFLE